MSACHLFFEPLDLDEPLQLTLYVFVLSEASYAQHDLFRESRQFLAETRRLAATPERQASADVIKNDDDSDPDGVASAA